MAPILNESQLGAVRRLRNGYILCGGVGTGKSRTALAYYFIQNGGELDETGSIQKTMVANPQDLYIITTARKRDTLEWEGESILFSMYPGHSAYIHEFHIDSWNNIQRYTDISGAFFIFDEQRVIGKGAWAKSFQKIAKKNNWILLSATPGDTWLDYMQVFIANGFYRNQTEFYQEHVIFSHRVKYPKVDRYINTGRLIRLRDKILVDIPFQKATEQFHEYIMVEYDRAKYKDLIKNKRRPDTGRPFENAAELCYALRKLINSDESRQAAVLELFESHPKMIIFYNFDYELELLKNLCYGDDVEIAEWNGHKHQPIPETEKWVYLVQYTAGAEGWNCILTDTIVFYSRNYSYKVVKQACGRIDRMNTPYLKLYYYHLISRASIDIMIGRALKEKKNFNEMRFISKIERSAAL
jgi:hypothetical protein